MIRSSVLFLILSFVSQFVYAQAPAASDSALDCRPNALQFQIADKFILQSFQGTTVSFKHHFDRLSACRLGVSLSFNTANNDNSNSNYVSDNLSTGASGNQDQTSVSVWIYGQRLWYVDNPTPVLLFMGTGPYVGISRSSNRSENTSSPMGLNSGNEQTNTALSAGLTGTIGVEWFASKVLSLHSEYFVNAGYSWSRNQSEDHSSTPGSHSKHESTLTAWQITSLGVKFGISVYF